MCRATCNTVSRSAWSCAVRSACATMTVRSGWVRAMCSMIGSTVVIPAPALASSSGPVRRVEHEIARRCTDVQQVTVLQMLSCR